MLERKDEALRIASLLLLLFWTAVVSSPANATASDVANCTAQTSAKTSYEQIITGSISKNCGNNRWSIEGPRVWLFFDKKAIHDHQSKLKLRTDLNRFTNLTIYSRDKAGNVASRHWKAEEAVKNWRTGSLMDLQLPQVDGEIIEVAVAIDHPWMSSMMTKAVITNDTGHSGQSIKVLFIICIFIGLALAPLIYNLAFYKALREPFLLCHLGMTFFCLAYTGLSSSLAYHFLSEPPLFLLTVLTPFAFSAAVSFASLFAASFIEAENLSPTMRKMLKLGSVDNPRLAMSVAVRYQLAA